MGNGRVRGGGVGRTPALATREVPTGLVGTLTLVASDEALVGCHFEREAAKLRAELAGAGDAAAADKLAACGTAAGDAATAVLDRAEAWLGRYLAGEAPSPSELPLEPHGTPFQLAVWEELRTIPYGQTRTYGQVAAALEHHLGHRMSAQAVGQAVGRNPIGVIVPCHRVMGASGRLTGFGGGIDAKLALLAHEGIEVAGLVRPRATNDRTS